MFTGIVETTTTVTERTEGALILKRPIQFSDLTVGQSISVNGACLSIVSYTDQTMSFDVVPETFQRTNLASATVVNLERALLANGRFEGHVVAGHVDTTASIGERTQKTTGEWWSFDLPASIEPFVVEKGSIALNGISLTVANVEKKNGSSQFSIALIPHTLQQTNLQFLSIGDTVNVEVDIMAKYWKKWQQEKEG